MTVQCNCSDDGPGNEEISADCGLGGDGCEPVIACSLDGADHAERLRRWHSLLAGARLTRGPLTATAEIPAERSAEAADLIRDEQACCPFLSFSLDFHGAATALVIGAPRPEAEPFIDALLPPETVTGR